MTVKKFNISAWDNINANYWGITKCGNTSVKYGLLEKIGKNIYKPEGIAQWVHGENITKYISKETALSNGYENFTVTRNPYNRSISMFNDFMKRKDLYLTALHSSAKKITTLDEFLSYLSTVPTGELNEHFKPQVYFIYENDKLLVDKIFDINEINEINKKYELSIPHINKTKNIRTLNPTNISMINNLYHEDFEKLNYNIYE